MAHQMEAPFAALAFLVDQRSCPLPPFGGVSDKLIDLDNRWALSQYFTSVLNSLGSLDQRPRRPVSLFVLVCRPSPPLGAAVSLSSVVAAGVVVFFSEGVERLLELVGCIGAAAKRSVDHKCTQYSFMIELLVG